MKGLNDFLQKIKPSSDGKFPIGKTLWDGLYTFLFVPSHTNKSGQVHIRDAMDLKRLMFTVIIALVPALLFGIFNVGHQHFLALGKVDSSAPIMAMFSDKFLFGVIKVLPVIVVSYAAGLGVEFLFAAYRKHSIHEGYLVSGLLIPMIMPVGVPLWMVAIASIFAVIIAKEVFGGTGMNVVNVALTARAFLFFAYPTKMSGDKVWIDTSAGSVVDGFSGATPLGKAVLEGVDGIPSLWESFIGMIPGSIGETSTLMILLGGLILVLTGVASKRIIFSTFLGGFLMGLVLNAISGDNPYLAVPALHQLTLGGFAFGAIFMATDPVSASQTGVGKYIYGFMIGTLAILIRVVNPAYPEGVMLAILMANVTAPLIDHIVVSFNIKKRQNRLKL